MSPYRTTPNQELLALIEKLPDDGWTRHNENLEPWPFYFEHPLGDKTIRIYESGSVFFDKQQLAKRDSCTHIFRRLSKQYNEKQVQERAEKEQQAYREAIAALQKATS